MHKLFRISVVCPRGVPRPVQGPRGPVTDYEVTAIGTWWTVDTLDTVDTVDTVDIVDTVDTVDIVD